MSECEGDLKAFTSKVENDMKSLQEKLRIESAEKSKEMQSELKESMEKKMSECEGDLKAFTSKVENDMKSLQEKLRIESAEKSKEMQSELKESMEKKMSECEGDLKAFTGKVDKQVKEQKSSDFETKKLIETLRDQIGKAEGWINQRIGQPIGPVTLEMHDYKYYQENGGDWFSSAFYTHRCGYKMCLNVFAKGYGKGKDTHISVYFYLMKGEFDTMLTWPFHGKITVQLISRRGGIRHYPARTIPFYDKIAAATKQVVDKERNTIGCGLETFISHDDIQKYEKDGSLQFEIIKVVID